MKKVYALLPLLFLAVAIPHTYAQSNFADTGESAVIHTVLFRFTENATPGQVDTLFQKISSLAAAIPGITGVTYGKNFSLRAKGFTYIVTMRFISRKALADFYVHPAHQALIRDNIKPILSDMIAADYEIQNTNQQ